MREDVVLSFPFEKMDLCIHEEKLIMQIANSGRTWKPRMSEDSKINVSCINVYSLSPTYFVLWGYRSNAPIPRFSRKILQTCFVTVLPVLPCILRSY